MAGWTEATTVAEKQAIAVQGHRIVDEVVAMGGKTKKQTIYQHPNATNSIPIPVQVVKPVMSQPSLTHTPMEVDAISAKNDRRNPFPAIRSICIQNQLCFRCLQPFEAKTHMVGGERQFPNKNASLSDKLALISDTKKDKKKFETTTHQIAALTIESDTQERDEQALRDLHEEEREAVGWPVEEYLSGRSEDYYPAPSTIIDPVEINSIRLMADTSYPRRVVVPLTLKDNKINVRTMAFLDIGSMTNFIDDRFAKENNLKLLKKCYPLKTEAYNVEPGLDVEWEWNGEIEGEGMDGNTERFDICLNVTCLGKHEIMIGLPWMEKVGCFLKLVKFPSTTSHTL